MFSKFGLKKKKGMIILPRKENVEKHVRFLVSGPLLPFMGFWIWYITGKSAGSHSSVSIQWPPITLKNKMQQNTFI